MICPKQLIPIENQSIVVTMNLLLDQTSVAYNDYGSMLAIGDDKGTIKVYKNDSDFTLLQTINSHSGPISSLKFSSVDQGDLLLSGGQDMSFKIYQTTNI